MCIQDVLIGRQTRGNLFSVQLTTTDPTLLLGANPNRRTLILFPHATVSYVVRFNDDAASPGFTVFTGNEPVKFNADEDGDIASRALFVSTAAGTEVITAYGSDFNPQDLKG